MNKLIKFLTYQPRPEKPPVWLMLIIFIPTFLSLPVGAHYNNAALSLVMIFSSYVFYQAADFYYANR